ncbi:PACE efflux transporter [Paracidovorax anthurii]|uniref:Putative membrane protein n=1 Tax=Paracidovorax anthurii TaxID=78229 RepID=A0A328ZL04_9BURK|nr:PACE efflux transporter [Paracidovorax anthurii]RAR86549.1 putative membrane protein [Paracidovorax anthurii]WCM93373.1 PACE efflux transporter [Acidovorax sp. NCPPB 2350]
MSQSSSLSPRPAGLQGPARRVLYVALYELIAIAVATLGLALATGQGAGHSGAVAAIASGIAIVWNVAFNWAFERWEARQPVRGRSTARRVAHAIGFEGGLAFILVPVLAWWFGVGLWEALLMDLGLLLFFLGYTFVFNWAFDRVFGLPASAQAVGVPG